MANPETGGRHTWAQASSSFLARQLRLFSFLQLSVGAAFITLASILIFPPTESALALCMWILGVMSTISSIFGCVAGSPKRITCCLSPFLTIAGLLLLAHVGFLLYLFIAPSEAQRSVERAWSATHPSPQQPPIDKIHSAIYIGRWVLLGLLGLQIISIFTALLLRCCTKNQRWEVYQDEETSYQAHIADTNAKLARLRSDVVAVNKAQGLGASPLKKDVYNYETQFERNAGGDSIAPYRPASAARGSAPAAPRSSGAGPLPTRSVEMAPSQGPFKPTWAHKAASK